VHPDPISRASNVASSNWESLKVEKFAVRPCMVAMKRCWLTTTCAASPYLASRVKSNAISDTRHTSVERIVPQEKACDSLVHRVASESQITRLNRGAKGCPREIDRGPDRLRPKGNQCHRVMDLGLVGDEAVLIDQIACKLGETITPTVTVKDRADNKTEKDIAVRRSTAHSVLHADVHHAARE
jgi:hypothetical protein